MVDGWRASSRWNTVEPQRPVPTMMMGFAIWVTGRVVLWPGEAKLSARRPGDLRDHAKLVRPQLGLPRPILPNLAQRLEPHRIPDDVPVGILGIGLGARPLHPQEIRDPVEHQTGIRAEFLVVNRHPPILGQVSPY